MSRPQSSKHPLLVYPVGSFQCLLRSQALGSVVNLQEMDEQDRQVLVLALFGEEGCRNIFFKSDDELFSCLMQVRKYQACRGNDLLTEYTQLSVLGEGGFGKVYLAQHKTTHLKVAIKLIDKQHLTKMYRACGETP